MADVLEMIFIHQCYDVDICNSWRDIDYFFYSKKPDLAIIGSLEQNLNVAQIIDEIREDKQIKYLPLIFLSGQADDQLSVDSSNECSVDPLNFYQLSSRVKSILEVLA